MFSNHNEVKLGIKWNSIQGFYKRGLYDIDVCHKLKAIQSRLGTEGTIRDIKYRAGFLKL